MRNKSVFIKKAIEKLKDLDIDNFYFIDAKLKCPHCNKEFGIDKEFIGIVTCPYCGKYVEG
ncbi:MAG: hydrogenase maturation nickel metallochaperone HypA [Bacteroidetes bacterium]|nr:hydrogenase maturation nickel metallochaperone HypA [Bacteroidota bacterium]MBU2636633.1 hydrogenase maturation nickel metallochaperone HypA [Bacteroidota bacterium]